MVREHFSSLYPLVWQAYSLPSNLFFGDSIISSATGVQQGDPLGPALFSLAIHPLIRDLSSVFNVWYLDDGTLGGIPQSITKDLELILHRSSQLGLNLNLSKCELYVSGADPSFISGVINQLHLLAPGIWILDPSEVMLLGSPLTMEALSPAFQSKMSAIRTLVSRLEVLFAHDAFYLLRHCFAIPKLLYLLRTSPSWRILDDLQGFDETIRICLQKICNINFDQTVWAQSTPTAKGGLGIRSAVDLCLPGFLSSCHGTSDLVASLLSSSGVTGDDPLLLEATN